jgi:hypothetical protein
MMIWLQKFLEFVASRHKIGLEEYRKGLPVFIFLDPMMNKFEKGMAITTLHKRRVGVVIHINPELNWEDAVLILLHELGHVEMDCKAWHNNLQFVGHGKEWRTCVKKLGVEVEVMNGSEEEGHWYEGVHYRQKLSAWKIKEVNELRAEFEKIWVKNSVNWCR